MNVEERVVPHELHYRRELFLFFLFFSSFFFSIVHRFVTPVRTRWFANLSVHRRGRDAKILHNYVSREKAACCIVDSDELRRN